MAGGLHQSEFKNPIVRWIDTRMPVFTTSQPITSWVAGQSVLCDGGRCCVLPSWLCRLTIRRHPLLLRLRQKSNMSLSSVLVSDLGTGI